MFCGLLFWLLLVKKERINKLALIVAAFTVIVICGVILDKFYYGNWTLTCLNYFKINLIQDRASQFGTTNWYTYILQVIFSSVWPIGLLIFLTFIILLINSPNSMLIWLITPLLLSHLLIPHKEIRFLFPLVNFVPLLLVNGYRQFLTFFPKPLPYRRTVLFVGVCLGILNVMAMLPSIFTPPANGRIAITRFVRDEFPGYPVKMYSLQVEEQNPFQPYSFLRQSFYELPNVRPCPIPGYRSISREMFGPDTLGLLAVHQIELMNPELEDRIKTLGLRKIKDGVPHWVLTMEGFYDRNAGDGEYVLYSNVVPGDAH